MKDMVYLTRYQVQRKLLWGLWEKSGQVSVVSWVGKRTLATSDRAQVGQKNSPQEDQGLDQGGSSGEDSGKRPGR